VSGSFTYRDLDVWKRAMDLVEHCYLLTASYPTHERYGLASQIRRAAISIPANIGEGHCRHTTKAYINYVSIALGSHGELETCVEISRRLGLIEASQEQQLSAQCASVGRLLNGLHRALERKLVSATATP
jgi:four helix bundle protein